MLFSSKMSTLEKLQIKRMCVLIIYFSFKLWNRIQSSRWRVEVYVGPIFKIGKIKPSLPFMPSYFSEEYSEDPLETGTSLATPPHL